MEILEQLKVEVCRCGHPKHAHLHHSKICGVEIQGGGVYCPCEEYNPRPTVITLCGSTRFKQAFIDLNKQLTCQGFIVLSVGFFGHKEQVPITRLLKQQLDDLHKQKIDLSDVILVLDVNGYYGPSTMGEINHAVETRKQVFFLNKLMPGYQEPTDQELAQEPSRPDFVVKAYDVLAPQTVRRWIDAALAAGVNQDKILGAMNHHAQIKKWQSDHFNEVKVPD